MSAARIFVFGDLHFKENNLADCQLMVQAGVEIVRKLQPDAVVVLGDVLHTFDMYKGQPSCLATEFFRQLHEICPLYIVMGNHDLPRSKSVFLSTVHNFNALKLWPQTYIVDKPLFVTVKGCRFLLCPYVTNGRFVEALSTVDEWRAYRERPLDTQMSFQAVFCHQEFRGCKMGNKLSTEGDEWSLEWPFVIAGHIHDPHFSQANVLYVGTPMQHGAHENGSSVWMFEFSSSALPGGGVDTAPTGDASKPTMTRYDLDLPKRKKVKLTYAQLDQLDDIHDTPKLHHHVRIVGSVEEHTGFLQRPQVQRALQRGLIVQTREPKNHQEVVTPTAATEAALPVAVVQSFARELWAAIEPDLHDIYHRVVK